MLHWKQCRPDWCPHSDCQFKRRAQDSLCGGKLPEPVMHDGTMNTHRFCVRESLSKIPELPSKVSAVFDLQVNSTDLDWFRWIFDALDKKKTGWLSRR